MGVSKELISKANLTLREELVMILLADGLSVREIVESGKVLAVHRKRGGAVGRQHVYNIKNKAMRKMRQRGLITD